MRILEITYTWPAETFIVRHAEALAKYTRIDLTIGARSPLVSQSASVQSAEVVGYQVKSLYNFDYMPLHRKLYAVIGSLNRNSLMSGKSFRDRALLKQLDSLQPDLIHFHVSSLAVIMAKYAQALGVPYTFSLRGSDIQVMPVTQEAYSETLCQTAINAQAVHTVVDVFQDKLRDLCGVPVNCSTIRTCVPTPEIIPDQPEPSSVRLISVGRLHWTKSFQDMIRAMTFLPDTFSLDIVGDGPEREHLTFLIHTLGLDERVRLQGSLSYDQFQSLCRAATAYVQTSITEGFSNALAEAMALGKPIFTTPAGGTDEIILDGQNGFLLPEGDPAAIASILKRASQHDLMNNSGKSARESALHHFSAEGHAVAFERFFQSALKGN